MGEHKLPREPFTAHHPSGIDKPIRELTDDELAEAIEGAKSIKHQLKMQFAGLLSQVLNAERAEALFAYEIDRRAKSITVVHNLQGLRQQ